MSKQPYELSPRCDYCGRFFKWGTGDEYTSFGGPCDSEPPEPVLQCGPCSKKDEEQMVRTGSVGQSWRPSQAEYRAAKRLGVGRAGPNGAAWALWFKLDQPLPEGYHWWE